jgi:hypothetical protein
MFEKQDGRVEKMQNTNDTHSRLICHYYILDALAP